MSDTDIINQGEIAGDFYGALTRCGFKVTNDQIQAIYGGVPMPEEQHRRLPDGLPCRVRVVEKFHPEPLRPYYAPKDPVAVVRPGTYWGKWPRPGGWHIALRTGLTDEQWDAALKNIVYLVKVYQDVEHRNTKGGICPWCSKPYKINGPLFSHVDRCLAYYGKIVVGRRDPVTGES